MTFEERPQRAIPLMVEVTKDKLAECFVNRGLLSCCTELDKDTKKEVATHFANCCACKTWAEKHHQQERLSKL